MARTLTERERRERVVVYLGASTIEKLRLLAKQRDDNLSGVIRSIIAERLAMPTRPLMIQPTVAGREESL